MATFDDYKHKTPKQMAAEAAIENAGNLLGAMIDRMADEIEVNEMHIRDARVYLAQCLNSARKAMTE